MSFSTLPPDSRTLVSKWNTKLVLIWKEDFGQLGNSSVLLLLSPGKTPLTTSVVIFLDTSVWGGCWYLDPSLSPFLVKFTQILESIFLDNPHKAAVLSVGWTSFSSTPFPSTQLSVNMLGYSTLWTASFFDNECLWLTLLVKGVKSQWLSSGQLSDQQSYPWLRSLVNQTERPFWRRRILCRCFQLISWLACHHILISWDIELVSFYSMGVKIITIKRTKDLNYFSLCAFNLLSTRVSQFELNYWNKWTFPRHSNLLRCTCRPTEKNSPLI